MPDMDGFADSPEVDDGPWQVTIPVTGGTRIVGYVWVHGLFDVNEVRIGAIEQWFLVSGVAADHATHRNWVAGQSWKFSQWDAGFNMGPPHAPNPPPGVVPSVKYVRWTHVATGAAAVTA